MTDQPATRPHPPGPPDATAANPSLWDQWQGFDPILDAPPLAGPGPVLHAVPHERSTAAEARASSLLAPPILAPAPAVAQTAPALAQSTAAATTSSVSTAGAVAMDVPAAIGIYGDTGSGITIGILSDSFDAQGTAVLAQEEADGDLPSSVDILQDYSGGTDEGRAMAELVHAVAPGAAIDFATADSTMAQFAANILALAAAGCKIIVDDVTYYDEPFFQLGNVIQDAIETVISEGVSYFTAASNEGINFYQAAISLVSADLPGATRASQLEDFGATAAANSGSDTLQQITIGGGDTVTFDLQWTQPFKSIGGVGTAYSLALYLYRDGTLVASLTTNVTGTDPVQVLDYDNTGGTGNFELAIALNGGAAPTNGILKYIIYAGNTTYATIDDSNAGSGSGTVIGHELLANVNTVGAIAAGASAPEAYSSVGPGEVYYTATDTALATPETTGKVDFLAPDGISTSVSGFSSFYGTSAAAPDAAAVGALLLEANPNLTPAELSTDLASTTTAISGSTTEVGTGEVNADSALAAAYGSYWTLAASGVWSDAAAWAAGSLPSAAAPVTLDDDLGTFTAAYSVTVDIATAAAETLSVGDDTSVAVGLALAAAAVLSVAGSATVAAEGRIADAGSLAIAGSLETSGGITVARGGTLSVAGDIGGAGGITLAAGGLLRLTGSASTTLIGGFTAPISIAGAAAIDLAGLAYSSAYTEQYAAGTLSIITSGKSGTTTTDATLVFATGSAYSVTLGADGSGGELLGVACYRLGTRIATPLGDVPIEQLRIGDPVLTAAGRVRVLRWIGHRHYSAAAVAANRAAQPIRIAAGALDALRPARDLWLSPEHALLLDGADGPVLVPARLLVNGRSIVREAEAVAITYIHLEFDAHDAVLAEGQPAESFVDDASRAMFDNAASYAARYPEALARPARFCAPRLAPGLDLSRLQDAVAARAGLVPGALRGSVDVANPARITGWAHDPDHPTAPVLLEFRADGISLGFALADQYRADLLRVGIGDGHAGFRFEPPHPLVCERPRLISICRAGDAAALPGGLVLIDRQPALEDCLARLAPMTDASVLSAFLASRIDGLRARRVG